MFLNGHQWQFIATNGRQKMAINVWQEASSPPYFPTRRLSTLEIPNHMIRCSHPFPTRGLLLSIFSKHCSVHLFLQSSVLTNSVSFLQFTPFVLYVLSDTWHLRVNCTQNELHTEWIASRNELHTGGRQHNPRRSKGPRNKRHILVSCLCYDFKSCQSNMTVATVAGHEIRNMNLFHACAMLSKVSKATWRTVGRPFENLRCSKRLIP